jgi:endonuclease G
VDQQTGLLSASGTGTFTFRTAVNGSNYYIVVKHRNAIETWSASVLSFTSSALSYNFTTAATQAYGSNMVLKGGKYCFYSGDVNQDNNVNLLDLIAIDNDNTNIATGYQITDLNGDGNVNLLDLIIVDNNNTAIVKRLAPSGTPPPSNVNLTMGNPSGATTNVNYPHNYLLDKPQFCASYDRDRGIPNWTSWQLNTTWCNGPGARQDNFIPDNTLPSDWYRVITGDYTGSGFSRGHMCPSADRINTQGSNDSVFVMTNMIPQTQANNGGPWEGLETYERTLADAGNVLYIISGGYGAGGTGLNGYATTIAGGKVTVPAKTWKVIIVLPAGTNDVSRVTTSTRTIAVIMNNDEGPFNNWGTYRVSVDSVESLTTYDFFSNVSTSIQAVIEANTDTGPTN